LSENASDNPFLYIYDSSHKSIFFSKNLIYLWYGSPWWFKRQKSIGS